MIVQSDYFTWLWGCGGMFSGRKNYIVWQQLLQRKAAASAKLR
ncbi:hypothetical protein SK3146_04789 [Paenibacillus konkukensis]|uniref:Uncharacterized protein n=1 Tax=Paenibacillus konkukensis TaxID=2020716 RepID=A0ABY4RTF0_9BACL|nr:hypothetical protein SK3146_04789 [Paenibacillus konkukensis]